MPSEMNQDGEDVVQAAEEFERRSKRMKDKLTVKAEAEEGPCKREEWMTELPPEMGKNFGLQTRTFSKGGGADDKDRSGWTENPAVKKEKDNGKGKKRKREDDKASLARDDQMQQQVEEYNKSKRPESFMDMHSKKLKKKKKKEKKEKKKGKEKKKEERRPFDRDKDLQFTRFDAAQRQALIKRSQQLNSKFTHGGTTSHFL
ncbi:GPALPP motifs-containing protein 1 [Bulinus truncatus]|nr:GPALPP motifs-containing protein 1 [Bulinus truncatus]